MCDQKNMVIEVTRGAIIDKDRLSGKQVDKQAGKLSRNRRRSRRVEKEGGEGGGREVQKEDGRYKGWK